jgi:hypothetical protein
VLETGKTAEVSPRVADNWAIVIPDSELDNDESVPMKATLVAYSSMSSLAEYQKKLTEISNKAGLKGALSALRTSYSEDLAKTKVKKVRRGKNDDNDEFTESTNTGIGSAGIKIPGVDSPTTSTSSIPIPGIVSGAGQTGSPFESGNGSPSTSIDIPGVPKSSNDK